MKCLALVDVNGPWVGSRETGEVAIPPVALLYLAASVKKQCEGQFRVVVVDFHFDFESENDFFTWLSETKPHYLGLRGLTPYKKQFLKICKQAKRINPESIIIGGGPLVTIDAEELVLKGFVDYAVKGEGDLLLPELLTRLDKGKSCSDLPGLVLMDEETLVNTGPAIAPDDLDSLPFPDYSLIDTERYSNTLSYAYNRRRQGVIVGSRGCPFKCTYCHVIHGKTARIRSAKNLWDEIKLLHEEHGINDFYFVEDIFNIDKKRFDSFFEKGLKLRTPSFQPKLYFVNGLRADIISHEQIDLMTEAGTCWALFAIETATPRLQQFIKKHLDLEKAKDTIEYAISKNIVVNYCAMYGFPTESVKEAEETLQFINSLSKPSIVPMLFELKYYAGSEIIEQAVKTGLDGDKLLETSSAKFHFPQGASPELSLGARRAIFTKFHQTSGLKSPHWQKVADKTLRGIGWNDEDILSFFSVLLNKKCLK